MLCPNCGTSVGDEMKLCDSCAVEAARPTVVEEIGTQESESPESVAAKTAEDTKQEVNPIRELLIRVTKDKAVLYISLGALFFLQLLYYMLIFLGEEMSKSLGFSLVGCGVLVFLLQHLYAAELEEVSSYRLLAKRLFLPGVAFIFLGMLLS